MSIDDSVNGVRAALYRGRYARWRIATYFTLVVLAAVAWLVSNLRMSGMDAGPGSALGTFTFFIITWVVMMAAMMFPSIAPMVATFIAIQRARRRKAMPAQTGATTLFVFGYLIAWTLLGVAAYALVRLSTASLGSGFTWHHGGRWLAAGVLLGAAVYEVTPLKQACLRRCRGPVAFIMTSWRNGRAGALQMGIEHGAWCVGCCWGLMAALFALGVMSLAWMSVIGVLIAIEKLLPWRRIGIAATTAVLLALAAGIAFAPSHVPGFTVPGHTMTTMN